MTLAAWWDEPGREAQRVNLFALLIITLAGIGNLLWGESTLANHGFVWDGVKYGQIALGFPQNFLAGEVISYYASRSLPSVLVNLGLRVVGSPINPDSVWRGFQVYNLVLLIASAWLWGRCLDLWELSATGRWLAWIGLYLNVAIAKLYFYTPVLTDQTAFFLGVALLYSYLRRQHGLMLLVGLLGAFSWSVSLHLALIVFVLTPAQAVSPYPATPAPHGLNRLLATGLATALTITTLAGYLLGTYQWLETHPTPLHAFVPLSIALLAGYLFIMLSSLLNSAQLFDYAWISRTLRPWGRLALAIPIYLLLSRAPAWIGAPSPGALSLPGVLFLTLQSSILYPGVFLISQWIVYGPLLLLVAAHWRAFVAATHREGLAATILIIIAGLFVCLGQSRFWINLLPWVILVLARILAERRWTGIQISGLAVLSFAASKCYVPFNAPPLNPQGPLLELPAQWVLMHYGSFISRDNYLLHMAGSAAAALLLWLLLRSAPGSGQQTEPAGRAWLLPLSLALMLFLAEGVSALRGGIFPPARTPVQTVALMQPIVHSATQTFTTPPGSALTLWPALYNELGYRGPYPEELGSSETPRLLLLQDLTTMPDERLFRWTVAGRLQQRADRNGQPLEVITAVNRAGDAPDSYLVYLQTEGLVLDPQHVVLISHPGDLADFQTHRWLEVDANGLPLRVQTTLELLDYRSQPLDPERFWYYRLPVLRQIAPFVAAARALTPPLPADTPELADALERYLRVIEASDALSRAAGADFHLLLLDCEGAVGLPSASELAQMSAERIGAEPVADLSGVQESQPRCNVGSGFALADEARLTDLLYEISARP